MFNYEVTFAHQNENAESDAVRHGSGRMKIETDHEIKNQEDLKEVARSIGLAKGFTAVAITEYTLILDGDKA